MITFDDGYFDNYVNAYPILKKYGFKAVIFVITSFMDEGNMYYFTWDQAKEMEADGISIESHTVSHQSMQKLMIWKIWMRLKKKHYLSLAPSS